MKHSFTAFALIALFSGLKSQAQAFANPATVPLGAAGNYTILAETVISTTGVTSIVGDIGTSSAASTLSGFGQILDSGGTFSTSSVVTAPGKIYAFDYSSPTPSNLTTAVTNMTTAYTSASGRTADVVGLGGTSIGLAQGALVRGVYQWNSSLSITSNLTLFGSASDIWIFFVTGDLDIADAQKVILTGGALPSNVFWAVAGTTTLVGTAEFSGNVIGRMTIAMQSGSKFHGKALGHTDVTMIGSTLDSAPIVVGTLTQTPTKTNTESPTPSMTKTITGSPTDSPTPSATPSVTPTGTVTLTPSVTPISTPSGQVSLGSSASYGVLAFTFTRDGGISTIAGNAGFTNLGGSGTHTHTGTGTDRVPAPPQAGLDQDSALVSLNGMACTFTFATGVIDLASDTTHGTLGVYTPGVYCIDGAMNISGGGTITLNGQGAYVFRSIGAFDSSDNSQVLLTGGANACDVFWVPGAATTLGANTLFKGTVIDNFGITVGTATTWQGRALAFAGTVSLDTDSIAALSCAPASDPYTGANPPASGTAFVFPSPARGDTVNVVYNMLESGRVQIRVYNEIGDLLTSVDEERASGPQKTQILVKGYSPGIYLYKVVLAYDSGSVDTLGLQKFAVLK